jgi:hypothetical protein
MNPLVRDLYKRFLMAGRVYPGGMEVVRRKTKEAFFSNAALTDDVAVRRSVRIGRGVVRELLAVGQLKKYRSMKNSYY